MPLLLYLIGRAFDNARIKKENAKLAVESENTERVTRKIEAEIAQNYIASAGDLVSEYKDMLKDLNTKYEVLANKLDITDKKLESEIKSRKQGERVIKELYRGIQILLDQMDRHEISPDWCVEDNIVKIIESMENKNE